ncbi:MAG: aminopeptidase [Clostridia bacterium]|nr:aminopeptidase [Clostridia bacterium]
MDARIEQLTDLLLTHSISLQPGEKVYIEYNGSGADSLVEEVIRKIYKYGGIPFIHHFDMNLRRELLMNCNKEQLKLMSDLALEEMKQMDCFIGIRSYMNSCELADIPSENLSMFSKLYFSPVHSEQRVNHTKWVILQYPVPAFAQAAGMSTKSFEDFYFKACTMDYGKLQKSMESLVSLMRSTDNVHIIGEGTDLTFSIKGINVIPCYGTHNIPDGEVYTAPIKDSIEGYISYNTPSIYNGYTFENIVFEFSKGKIVNATANNTKRINDILDTDEGSRYIGEFSFGVNPFITFPMKDTLFDEKICGSFHLTPGHCYKAAPNGNDSAIHWDLVCIQTPSYGGGKIFFDDVLIREDGIFVHPDLLNLNPNNF